MFTRILRSFSRKVPSKLLGAYICVGLGVALSPKVQMVQSGIGMPNVPREQNLDRIEFPETQSYYIVVYDKEAKEAIESVMGILSKEKQQKFMMEKDKFEQQLQESVGEPLTIFYKSQHIPFRIKLDISKGNILSQVKNIQSFVSEIKEEEVPGLASNAKNTFNNPLVVVDVYNQQNYERLKTQAFLLTNLNLVNPLQSRIYVVRHQAQEGRKNKYRIMRNDLLSQLEGSPETWQVLDQNQKPKGSSSLTNFWLPRIHTIRDYLDFSVLNQKVGVDPDQYCLSVNISPHDKLSRQKLQTIHQLYKRYNGNFNFVVNTMTKFKSILMHTSKQADNFCIYNFQKTLESNIQQRKTYEKLYMGNYEENQSFQSNLNRLTETIDKFLNKQLRADQLNVVPTETHFEINSTILKKMLRHSTDSFWLRVCHGTCRDWDRYTGVKYWIDSSVHNIGVDKDTCLQIDPENKVVRQKLF